MRNARGLAGAGIAAGVLLFFGALTVPRAAATDLVAGVPEPLAVEQPTVATLGPPHPHWILVNDFNALGPMDSKVYLFDADSGTTLGMLSTGGWRNAVETAPDFSVIYSPETYYARGTRGPRTDVVTFYDTHTLAVVGEAEIPPKRASGMPQRAYSARSDDGRFVFVANMTPATSVSVVDTRTRQFTAEIETSGCGLVYGMGDRRFGSLCGDGTLLTVTLDESGQLASRSHTARFFEPEADPLTEKAARSGDEWLFFSFAGHVHPIAFDAAGATPGERWSLFDESERAAGGRVGGLAFAAVHEATRRLYVIVHQGGPDTHKHPGEAIWVYDLDTRRRVQVIDLVTPATVVAVSRDAAPLLYTTRLDVPAIMVYDARSGAHLRVIEGPPFNPTHIQVP
jgi:methylamine dehydrogenase heavy chain